MSGRRKDGAPYKEGATTGPYEADLGDVAALRMSISDEEDAERAADVVVKLSKATEVPLRGVTTDVPSAPSSCAPTRRLHRTYSDSSPASPKELTSARRTESSANLHFTEPGSLRDPRWSETKYDSADSTSQFPPDEAEEDFLGFLVDDTLASKYNYIQAVLPNFRDVARSSCCVGIKPNLLFRSARPFGDHHALRNVLLETLGITTIIDLRDDNLLAIREEEESRLKVSKLYQIAHVSQQAHALAAPHQVYPWQTLVARRKAGAPESPQSPLPDGECVLQDAYREARLDEFRLKVNALPVELAEEIIDQPGLMPLYEFAMRPEIPQALVINVLDAPAVKRRVLQHATERANLRFLPLVVAAKAIDKITGVNSLAPYYFCRFVISTHAMENTYYEMIDSCGPNFSLALKLIALAPGPVLFHCSLGKDRTSILSMLLLHILGATEQGIIFDYALTERATSKMYHDYVRRFITDLSGLPESFCDAGPAVMRLTLDYVKQTYGSIDTYLDSIKFGKSWRQVLRTKYLSPALLTR